MPTFPDRIQSDADGPALRIGDQGPSLSDGQTGDVWLDTTGPSLYGPKGATWGTGSTLRPRSLDVRNFGAVGDGTTDDTAAIQAAIDFAAALGGGTVALPDLTFRAANLVLKSGVSLISDAAHYGYISGSIDGACIKANASGWVIDTPATAIYAAAVSGININGNNQAGGIRIQNGSWCAVRRINIDACTERAIKVDAGLGCVFEDILAINCLTGSAVARVGVIDISGSDHYLNRIEASASLGALTDSNMYKVAVMIRGAVCKLSDVVGEISDIGIVVTGNWNRLVNCRADLNWGHGFIVSGSKNTFIAPLSLTNGRQTAGTYSAFQCSGGSNHFIGPRVDCTSGTCLYAIEDTANTAEPRDRNTWTDPQINHAAVTTLFATTAFLGSGISFPPHPIRPTNAATSWDVKLTSLVVCHSWTGTATLTAMTNAAHGQQVAILGPTAGGAAVTIPNGSSFKTTSGSDLVLEAGKSATFTFYNAVWYQT